MPDWKEAIRECLAQAKLDPASEADVVDELAEHLDQHYQELRARGIPEEECRSRTLAELDGDELPKGVRLAARKPAIPTSGFCISASKSGYAHGLRHDLKIALRNIRTKPSFSLLVIGMLAVGIAGNAAIFSIFNGLLLRPLPFAESDRLIDLDETAPKWNLKRVGVSVPDFYAWRRSNSSFDGMAFFTGVSYNLSDEGNAQRVQGAQVTREMLDVLRLTPIIGRNFRPEEDKPGGARVVLLNYSLWQRVFHADRRVLGRVVKLDEQPYTVVGILPPEALFPNRADLWIPLAADPNGPSGYYLSGVGRLKRGVSMGQAEADLLRIHKTMIPEGRKVNEITSPILTPLRDRYLGDFKIISRVLLAAVVVLLLVTCVNIAALVTVRSSFRSREIAIRTALGASRARIVSQLLTENMVLGAAAGLIGIPLGAACLRLMVSRIPAQVPQWISFSLDLRFALFCIVITGMAPLLFGLTPSLQVSRIDIRGSLQDTAARTTATRHHRATLGTLVVCETGLALVLSISAGLLVQAFREVLRVDPGFRPQNVLTFGVSLPNETYEKPEEKLAYYDKLLAQLRKLPGVDAVGASSAPPLTGGHWGGQFEAEGEYTDAQRENPVVLRVAATPGYVEAIGMTLLDGRTFEPWDCTPHAALVVMVNETFAKHFWRTGSPIGKRIRYPGGRNWYQVIALMRDAKHDGLDQDVTPTVFLPYPAAIRTAETNDFRSLRLMSIILRGSIDPKTLVNPAREIVHNLDVNVPMYGVQTMTEQLDQSLWARRAYSWLFGVFAFVATLLATAGVYGVMSYVVSRRTQEIGIRIALGARPVHVLRHVLLNGMALVSMGVAAGLLCSLWATRLLEKLLFDVSSRDPLTYAAVILTMISVGLLANLVPARRAATMDPMRALHFE